MDKVIKYATEKHSGQKRKNSQGNDYITHPLEVKKILLDHGVSDYNTLAGAILHDTIEDTSATYLELKENFGQEIADIVQEVSDDKSIPKEIRKKLQASRISKKSYSARMIKIADKLSNTKDLLTDPPVHWSELDIKGYIIWSLNVCENAMSPGDTPKKLVDFVKDHFRELGAYDYDSNILEDYYKSLLF